MLLAAQPAYHTPSALPVMLASGASAALAVRASLRRDQSYLWMIIVAAVSSVAVTATGVAAGAPTPDLIRGVIYATATSVVSVIAAMLFLPWAERLTGHETHLTLLEWADLNRPLLQRLSLEAPGTYAHTIAIANLAEAACRGDRRQRAPRRAWARTTTTSASSRKPQYFVENQARGRNPHDQLKPDTSASIIRNHVREGLELADEVRLPATIRAFITEHHGTARSRISSSGRAQRDGVVADPDEFAYPGPDPAEPRDRDRDARRRRGGGGARAHRADARAHSRGHRSHRASSASSRASCARRRSRCEQIGDREARVRARARRDVPRPRRVSRRRSRRREPATV